MFGAAEMTECADSGWLELEDLQSRKKFIQNNQKHWGVQHGNVQEFVLSLTIRKSHGSNTVALSVCSPGSANAIGTA